MSIMEDCVCVPPPKTATPVLRLLRRVAVFAWDAYQNKDDGNFGIVWHTILCYNADSEIYTSSRWHLPVAFLMENYKYHHEILKNFINFLQKTS